MNLRHNFRFLRNFLNFGGPAFVILYVTSRCNSRCRYCFYWKEIESPDKKDELTLDEIKKISSKIGRFHQLSLTGGEPTLRDDLPAICEVFARNNHINYITIPTNGLATSLVVSRIEECLKRCPDVFFRIPLSIDGMGEDYDYLRGTKDGFNKVIATYHALAALRTKYPNFVIDVNTVFSGINQDRIKKVIDYVHENLDVENHTITYARGDMKDKESAKTDAKLYKEVFEYNQALARRKDRRAQSLLLRAMMQTSWGVIHETLANDKMVLPCKAGSKLVIISEKGEVRPCEILPNRFGNLRDYDYDLSKVLSTPKAKETIKWIKDTKCKCTFECAVNTNVVFGWRAYPRVLRRVWQLILRGDRAEKESSSKSEDKE